MSEPGDPKVAAPESARSAAGIARRMRQILDSPEFPDEARRKAALRRLLHEGAAGRKPEEIDLYVEELRGRFPDRVFETTARTRRQERSRTELEEEASRLRTERDQLRSRARALDVLFSRLQQAAVAPGTGGTVGGSIAEARPDPEALGPLAEAVRLLFAFAADQEATAASVAETLGRGSGATHPPGGSLSELLRRMARGEPSSQSDLADLERRLRRLRLLPGALMAGAQQSWKGGTREILDHLDPKGVEKTVSSKVPGLHEKAVLKELRHRFEEFWNQFDKNLAHYYRGKFERVYSEKMEDRS